jgi:hypothetical protein
VANKVADLKDVFGELVKIEVDKAGGLWLNKLNDLFALGWSWVMTDDSRVRATELIPLEFLFYLHRYLDLGSTIAVPTPLPTL